MYFFFVVSKLVLCDSIPKYVTNIKSTQIQPYPGINIDRLKDRIAFRDIKVTGYKAILLHVGTNDVPPYRDHRSQQCITSTIDSVVSNYSHLISVIRRYNSNCIIIISAIIHRPVDFVQTHFRVKAINQGLQRLCENSSNLIFNPTYKFFLHKGQPESQYYARDRLHLKGHGVLRIQQAFQQALSDTNLRKANHWRRSSTKGKAKGRPGRLTPSQAVQKP